MNSQTKNQAVIVLLTFTGVLFLFVIMYISFLEKHIDGKDSENTIVLLNEIRQLTTMEDGSSSVEPQIEKLQEELGKVSFKEQRENIRKMGAATVIAIMCYT
ncbi:MAG: hypothetical protein K2M91_14485, partial [Lachnospiraceae bacterium]|nr:hypothetical protein [Lachnospiraceae bacterium]